MASNDELEELLNRMKLVYGKVGGNVDIRKPSKDKFENLKYDTLKAVDLLKTLCDKRDKQRGTVRDGNTVRLKQRIRGLTSSLKTNMGMLRAMHDKAMSKAMKKKKKQTKEQLKKRGKALDKVEGLVQEALDRANPAEAAARKRDEADDFDIPRFDVETGEIVDGRGSPVSFEGVRVKTQEQLTDGDRQALAQMEEQKNIQDDLLDEMGELVTNLGTMATAIGEELDVQNQQIADLDQSVEDVHAKVKRANGRLDETLKMLNSKSDKFCCYMIFLIIILGLLSIVFNMVT